MPKVTDIGGLIVQTLEVRGGPPRIAGTGDATGLLPGFPTITGEPYSENPSDNLPAVELGKGYWIYPTGEGVVVP